MQPEGREEGRVAAEARGQHTQQTFYLEARGLGACHPHLLAGRKEHLSTRWGLEGRGCPAQSSGGAGQQGRHQSRQEASP